MERTTVAMDSYGVSSMTLFTIQMVSEAAVCNVLVRDWPREAIPRDWIGGRVRVAGINRAYLPGNGFLSVVVPSPDQVTVLKTGVVDPVDAPLHLVVAAVRTRDVLQGHDAPGGENFVDFGEVGFEIFVAEGFHHFDGDDLVEGAGDVAVIL